MNKVSQRNLADRHSQIDTMRRLCYTRTTIQYTASQGAPIARMQGAQWGKPVSFAVCMDGLITMQITNDKSGAVPQR
jgi:hypothetical protein